MDRAPELLKRVAQGKIAIAFDMHDSEVTSLHRPPAFNVMAPRQSYLPLVARSARESFEEAAPDVGESGVWFEHEGRPLRWNLPIGVLYDYYHLMRSIRSGGGDGEPNEEADYTPSDLPFKVTIRFQGFPKSNLLPCTGEVDAENAFFNSMKQALCLKYGSAKRLMDMPKTSQENLWEGIVFNKFERYWQSCQGLIATGDEMYEYSQVPIRVLFAGPEAPVPEGTMPGVARALQASVRLTEGLSLKQAITIVLRNNGFNADMVALFDQEDEDPASTKLRFRVVIQGVSPPLDAPLKELCEEMCAHDLFLYVVVALVAK